MSVMSVASHTEDACKESSTCEVWTSNLHNSLVYPLAHAVSSKDEHICVPVFGAAAEPLSKI